jgi:hypothetical protein
MTNQTTFRVLSGLVLLGGVAACNADDITKVNNNPNSPTNAPAGAVFTNAVINGVGRFLGWAYNGRGAALVVQHLAQTQYPDEDQYRRLDASSTSGYFNTPYQTELEDFQKVVDAPLKAGVAGGVALIAGGQQLIFEYITDTFGDVPYSEALKGDAAEGILLPKYDAQKDIYTGMMAALTKVATDLGSPGNVTLGSADPIYGGSAAAWQRFANTLHARLALRIINVDPATAASELQKALNGTGGVFRSNSDNAVMKWPGDGVFNNSWSDNFKTRDDHRLSQTLMNAMLANSDPRVPDLRPADSSPTRRSTRGCLTGCWRRRRRTYFKHVVPDRGRVLPGCHGLRQHGCGGASYPQHVLTYAELLFIKAEAAERGIAEPDGGAGGRFYRDAIAASMDQWGDGRGEISAFSRSPAWHTRAGTDGLKQIAAEVDRAVHRRRSGVSRVAPHLPAEHGRGRPAAIVNYIPAAVLLLDDDGNFGE